MVCENPMALKASSTSPFNLLYGKFDFGDVPADDMSRPILLPFSCAALANAKFKSWSISRCFAKEPAWARVVPIAVTKALGAGLSSLILSDHLALSSSISS